ncbi:MAG: HypC/HybG/HupF family hydrogenase formation chaperone [Betaproteobacteria bacterium]|nr:HypC/HybG/HupF family hydrogenase formation chaperone [Betaproteobacteria bacterium]
MCLGLPMRVTQALGNAAWCERRGERALIDLTLVGEQPVGAWLLVHRGAAREQLTPQAAVQIDAALDALSAALTGDTASVDAAFADLVEHAPELPSHLRAGKP